MVDRRRSDVAAWRSAGLVRSRAGAARDRAAAGRNLPAVRLRFPGVRTRVVAAPTVETRRSRTADDDLRAASAGAPRSNGARPDAARSVGQRHGNVSGPRLLQDLPHDRHSAPAHVSVHPDLARRLFAWLGGILYPAPPGVTHVARP